MSETIEKEVFTYQDFLKEVKKVNGTIKGDETKAYSYKSNHYDMSWNGKKLHGLILKKIEV